MKTDPNCIFCRIVAGELPSQKVYEDDEFLGFLDIRPLSPGHSLVIPKEHYRWVWDVPNIGRYFEVVRKVAKAVDASFGTDEIHSKIEGQEVPHAHIWIFPNPEKTPGDTKDFAGNAEKIRDAIV